MCSYHFDDEFEFDPLKQDANFRRMLLNRLCSDCEYFLGAGHRKVKDLWAKDVEKHIALMRKLWYSFDDMEKPSGITLDDIMEYEDKMLN